ncbi:hypothetical protein T459_04143 [Capsicum annuum]|uniref:Uncharacterized protein n=1 Tax=Capsicum annuum TaxID=4072 RepID=A0A2G3A4A9_CAPAN|nr:hypothetical protein T459_04143 [Capsicum annuum]
MPSPCPWCHGALMRSRQVHECASTNYIVPNLGCMVTMVHGALVSWCAVPWCLGTMVRVAWFQLAWCLGAQPSELILFPKLRIYFADFPSLYYSVARGCSPWRPDAVMSMLTLEPFSEDQGRPASGAHKCQSRQRHALPATIEEMEFHERIKSPNFGPLHQSTLVHPPIRSADCLIIVPHSIGTPRQPLSASLLTISSTLCLSFKSPFHLSLVGPGTTGLSPSLAPSSSGLGLGPPLMMLLKTIIQMMDLLNSKSRDIPVRFSVDHGSRVPNPDDEDLGDDKLLNLRRAEDLAASVKRNVNRDRHARMSPERRTV